MLPNLIDNKININGADLHYYRAGTGSRQAVVLAHGFSDNGLCWLPVAEALIDRYDILMPDARGHGLSARVQPGQAIDLPSDLDGLLRALNVPPAIVFGHSMGAGTAFGLGVRFPERVSALVLEDPPWRPSDPAQGPAPRPSMQHSPMGEWVRSLPGKTLEQLVAECHQEHPAWPEAYVQPWCQGKKQLDPNFLSTQREMSGGWPDQLGRIACPTLLITADVALGGIIGPELAQQIVQSNPHFRLAHIPGVGHHVRFGNHALYMQAVEAFLGSLP